MNFVAVMLCKSCEDFSNEALHAELTVKKWRDDGEPQISVAFELLAAGEAELFSGTPADDRACQAAAIDRH